MKNRPHINSSGAYKIKKVRKLTKEGDYLKEEFYQSKISNETDSIFGYKHFVVPKKFKGYDRGLYETLKSDGAKEMFACHCRDLELGEFKNGKMDGYGARYSYDGFGYEDDKNIFDDLEDIGIIGKFLNGLPNGKMLFYSYDHYGSQCFALTIWDKGKLKEFHEDYHYKNIDIQDEIVL